MPFSGDNKLLKNMIKIDYHCLAVCGRWAVGQALALSPGKDCLTVNLFLKAVLLRWKKRYGASMKIERTGSACPSSPVKSAGKASKSSGEQFSEALDQAAGSVAGVGVPHRHSLSMRFLFRKLMTPLTVVNAKVSDGAKAF